MIDFIESPRFPDDISYGSSGGPGFKTFIFEGHSGEEQRNVVWQKARGRWNITQGIRDKADMDTLREFMYEMRGMAVGFRYKDWADYQLTLENIGTGDAVLTKFNLIRSYGITNPYVRRIFKPVAGTVQVFVNAVLQVEGVGTTQYVLDTAKGTITFGTAAVPAVGHAITVTCEYDVPARFDTDEMSSSHEGFLAESWSGVPIVELLLEE